MTSDGAYKYTYDAEGNCTAKFRDTGSTAGALDAADTDVTVYTWDYRDRLTSAMAHRSIIVSSTHSA
jgi:hypothetical protein